MNVFFHTFGCRANQYDTALVRQAFTDQGAVVVDEPAEADLAVVNSCAVTGESEAKLRRYLRQLARRQPALETVVMGCATALGRHELGAMPRVRAAVPGADPNAVLEAAGCVRARAQAPLRRFGTHARGWLRIQDGCDEHCTFCATVLARGASRSRPIAEVVEEARALAAHHAELVLTGIHIGTYGCDWRSGAGGGPSALGELLEALLGALPQVRFRLSSIEASEVDDRVARLLIDAPRQLAPHLHAPLQSGSDRVLRRMGRHWYTARSYRARIEWLAARIPVFGLGADLIAGFPGEAEADHQATLALVQALPFSYLHVFPFSPRPGVAATRLGDPVPPAVRRARAAELRACGAERAATHRARRRGAEADGVASGHSGGHLEVVTEDYLSLFISTDAWDGRPRFPLTVA